MIDRNGILLIYVSRAQDMNNFELDYDIREEILIKCINLCGPKYQANNSSVFLLLLTYTEDTEDYSLILMHERRCNGCLA